MLVDMSATAYVITLIKS